MRNLNQLVDLLVACVLMIVVSHFTEHSHFWHDMVWYTWGIVVLLRLQDKWRIFKFGNQAFK